LVKEGEIIATKPIIKPGKVKGKMIGYGDEGPIYEVREGGKIPEIIPASYKNSEPFVWTENRKVKWQVGKDYAVQLGRGKKGLWYCPKCKIKKSLNWFVSYLGGMLLFGQEESNSNKAMGRVWNPLRIEITGLKKQKLLKIQEAEAKKEGFKDRFNFITYFLALYKKKVYMTENRKGEVILDEKKLWNPEVWAISFKVKT